MPLGFAVAAALSATPPDTSAAPAPPPAARAAGAQSVTSYTAADFASSQPNTALDMVTRLPGFSFDGGDNVRGFGGAAGNVIIDGVRPASKDDPLGEILKRIPIAQVLRIDVIRGGAPGIDMQGKSVIANVIRRQDGGLKLTTAGALNLIPDGRVEPSMRLEASRRFGATSIEGGLLLGRGIDDGAGDGSRVIRDAAGLITQTGLEHQKGEGDSLKLTGSLETPVAGGRLGLNATLDREPFRSSQHDVYSFPLLNLQSEEDHQYRDTASFGARYERPIGWGMKSETYLLQKWLRNDFLADVTGTDGDAHFALRRTGGESIVRSLVKRSFGTAWDLEAGGEGAFNFQNAHTAFADATGPVHLPAANVRVTEMRGEAFGTATWRATPKLTIETGIRIEASKITSTGDVVSQRTLFYPKPRVLITWSPTSDDQIRLHVEREVDQLNFGDFAAAANLLGNGVQVGNPVINPGQDWIFEATLEHRFWKDGQISVTGRHFALRDVIDRALDGTGQFDSPANIGSGYRNALLVSLTVPTDRLGLKRGQFQGSLWWRKSRVTDPTTHTLREPSGLHPFDWEIHYTQGLPRLKSTWGFDMFGQWRETYFRFNEIDNNKLATWVSVFVEYKPRPDVSLRVELQNAGARGFEFIRDVYNGPRNANPLDSTDTRNTHFGRMIYIRARKTFG